MIPELSLIFSKLHCRFWHIFCAIGLHSFVVLYHQPKYLTNNILSLECKCGKKRIELNGNAFLKKEAKRGVVYLIKY